jgi:Zn-dependent M32 family carboxypeptidase
MRLLDDYEPGMMTAEVRSMFDALRTRQVAPCARNCRTSAGGDLLFARDVPGGRRHRSCQASESPHSDTSAPRADSTSRASFAIAIGSDDVRITTRFNDRNPFEDALQHHARSRHALYEQGVSPVWTRTAVRGRGIASASTNRRAPVGKSHRAFACVLATRLPVVPGTLQRRSSSPRLARRVLSRHQRRAAVADPRRGR